MAQQTLVGHCFLIIEASRSHSDAQHSVGLLWTSDRSVAEVSVPDKAHNTHKKETLLSPTGFETAIPATDRPLKLRHIEKVKLP